jgi:cytochrome oxidase Cu insertion factor (SCO1/SenC/PrrC family)
LLCLTLDASYDTPAVMKAYVDQTTTQNITPDKWQFLTGDQDAINSYITKAFFIEDPQNTAQLFLIDTIGNIRGQYNGNLEEDIKAAIEDIALLKKEMDIRSYEEKKRAEQNNSNTN